jgi:hypothetical protein
MDASDIRGHVRKCPTCPRCPRSVAAAARVMAREPGQWVRCLTRAPRVQDRDARLLSGKDATTRRSCRHPGAGREGRNEPARHLPAGPPGASPHRSDDNYRNGSCRLLHFRHHANNLNRLGARDPPQQLGIDLCGQGFHVDPLASLHSDLDDGLVACSIFGMLERALRSPAECRRAGLPGAYFGGAYILPYKRR